MEKWIVRFTQIPVHFWYLYSTFFNLLSKLAIEKSNRNGFSKGKEQF